MRHTGLIPNYIRWHYSDALGQILGVWKNFLWFIYSFFSIPLLIRSLFSPWQRIQEQYTKGFDLAAYFSSLLINILMRLLGAFIRIIFIVAGVVSIVGIIVAGIIFYALWLLAPAVLIVVAGSGLGDIVQP